MVPYFLLVYVIGLAVPAQPPEKRFWTIIPLILLGYLLLNSFFLKYFRDALARTGNGPASVQSVSVKDDPPSGRARLPGL